MKKLIVSLALVAGSVNVAAAQTFPSRPITMIVPFAEGGPTDVIARLVSVQMGKALKQPVNVENVLGGGGTTGITQASQAKNDGYTIMMGHMGTHGAAPAMYPKLKYDPSADFEPIGMTASTPIVLVAKKDFPAKSLNEMVTYLKANASTVTNGHAGIGSVSHMSCIVFNNQIGITPTAVPYSGTGPALSDLVSNQVDYMCDQIVNLVSSIKAGSINAYAIALPQRSPALPDVPTMAEAGLPDYQVLAWNAVFAPKGTPKDVVAALSSALDAALENTTTQKQMADLGAVIPGKAERGGDWLRDFVKSEVLRWNVALKSGK